jgi:HlyD family secretion protein
MSKPWRAFRRWTARVVVLAALAGAGFAVYRVRTAGATPSYPSTPVRQGEFLVLIRCRGALKANSSVGIYTPAVPNLRISWITPAASANVTEGEPILRFDSSTAQQQLLQKESQLKQAQATLDQAMAQAKITAQQDQTTLADAKFSVDRANVAVLQNELQKGRVAGDESREDLAVAEQKLKVQDATVALHKASDASRIASLARQRDQAQTDVDLTRSRIAQMELKAPGSGLMSLRINCSAAIYSTSECKPYKVGDNVSSGMVLGEIPDLNSLAMDVKLEEADRGRVSAGQEALVRVDAIPELTIPVKVTEASAMAEMRMEYPYTRNFRAVAALPHPDSRLRPDMNGGMDIIVNRIPNAIGIPAKALFTRAGKPIVYVSENGGYRAVEVEVLARNPDEVAISGIGAGSRVALVDIARQEPKK